MAIEMGVVCGGGGERILAIQVKPEFLTDVSGLLRMLKKEFPEEYRGVWYEVVVPQNGRLNGLVAEE